MLREQQLRLLGLPGACCRTRSPTTPWRFGPFDGSAPAMLIFVFIRETEPNPDATSQP
jgi:hypothetical protein